MASGRGGAMKQPLRDPGATDWKLCLDWLVDSRMLPSDHKLVINLEPSLFEVGQLLKDGVLICLLLNRLRPNVLDTRSFSQRPQSSQYLCKKNIRAFLDACKSSFGFQENDLFEISDLLEMQDVKKVFKTLSLLSKTHEASSRGLSPFFVTKNIEDDIYSELPLHLLAAGGDEEETHDVIFENGLEEANAIYGCIMARNAENKSSTPNAGTSSTSTVSIVSCSGSTEKCPSRAVKKTGRSKRENLIEELLTTEQKYIDVLQSINEHFVKKLCHVLQKVNFDRIFQFIKELLEIHQQFRADLSSATSLNDDETEFVGARRTLSDCFIVYKEKFLIYGQYCSRLTSAQNLVNSLCSSDKTFQDKVKVNGPMSLRKMACQQEANEGRFTLHDLLTVPMQRILKYPLLLKELIGEEIDVVAKRSMQRALDEMLDLSQYINEVKRDFESLQVINDIESSIQKLQMPPDTHLRDYGHLLIDGELKMKSTSVTKTTSRNIFLFEKLMLICKCQNESYIYQEFLMLSKHKLEVKVKSVEKQASKPPANLFYLESNDGKTTYTFTAATPLLCSKWVEAISLAKDNHSPTGGRTDTHHFFPMTFDQPTICDVCRKLLLGLFFQGYKCSRTNVVAHKACLPHAREITAPPSVQNLPPKRSGVRRPSNPSVSSPTSLTPGVNEIQGPDLIVPSLSRTCNKPSVSEVIVNGSMSPTTSSNTVACRTKIQENTPPAPPPKTSNKNRTDRYGFFGCPELLSQTLISDSEKSGIDDRTNTCQESSPVSNGLTTIGNQPLINDLCSRESVAFSPSLKISKEVVIGRVRAVSDYNGYPQPPNSLPLITFYINDVIELLSSESSDWWEGRMTTFDGSKLEGFFPSTCVVMINVADQKQEPSVCLRSIKPPLPAGRPMIVSYSANHLPAVFPGLSSPCHSPVHGARHTVLSSSPSVSLADRPGLPTPRPSPLPRDRPRLLTPSPSDVFGSRASVASPSPNFLPGGRPGIPTPCPGLLSSAVDCTTNLPGSRPQTEYPNAYITRAGPSTRSVLLPMSPEPHPVPVARHEKSAVPPVLPDRPFATRKPSSSEVQVAAGIAVVDYSTLTDPALAVQQQESTALSTIMEPSHSSTNAIISANSASTSSISENGQSQLEDYPWFAGKINRVEATAILKSLPNGSFLVRVSPDAQFRGIYVLSIIFNVVQHIRIEEKESGDGEMFIEDLVLFRQLNELIDYYRVNSLADSFPDVPTPLLLPYKSLLMIEYY